MKIVYHLGLHCTDDERLLRTLLKNRELLRNQGVAVPGPSRYRPLLRETLQKLRGEAASAEVQHVLLDGILEDETPERLIMSHQQFLGIYARVHGNNQMYPQADSRVRAMRALFPDHEVEFHFALRDLATFFPAVFQASTIEVFEDFMGNCDLRKLSWSEMIMRMRQAVPDAPFVVWANEDTPLIWPEILETVCALEPGTVLAGTDDILAEVMTASGFQRFKAYIAANPPLDRQVYGRIVNAFLDKYIDPDKIEQDIQIERWTENVITYLSEAYEADLETIATIPGVDLIMA